MVPKSPEYSRDEMQNSLNTVASTSVASKVGVTVVAVALVE